MHGWTRSTLVLASALILGLAGGCQKVPGGASTAPSSDRLSHAASEPQNWLTHGGTYAEQRFAPLTDIDDKTVGRLGLAWSLDLDTDRGQESTPLVVDGVMYVTTAWSKVVAIDAATGQKLWQYDPVVPGEWAVHACCDVVNRGAAYDDGRIFVGTIDGRLIALDAKKGSLIWSTQTTDRTKAYTITGAPRVARGKVFIGNGGADEGVRGFVSAYDAKTGKLVWRFYTVPGDPAYPDHAASDEALARLARPTWFGDKYWKYGGGGTVWDSIVYDPELNRLYVGVGNGGPWSRKIRSEDKGDNLFVGSILALDPDTGKYLWHYQETPGDSWDFTSTQQMVLGSLAIDGQDRKVIMHAPKNGFFYVLDRATGKVISAEKFVDANWAERIDLATGRPVENPAARYSSAPFVATSGAWGGHSWHPMAYSPATGLMYIPAQQIPMVFTQEKTFAYRPGLLNLGIEQDGATPDTPADIAAMKAALKGWLVAWDPVRQKEVWRVPHDGPGNGGVLATAGNLVFQGLADRTFNAYDARSGKSLWSFDAQQPVLPGPISYAVGGVQYIAVLSGDGAAYRLAMPNYGKPRAPMPGRVLAFRIGGTATLPPVPAFAPANANPSAEKWPEATVAAGAKLFATTCGVCHGAGARSSGVVPDLRRSAALGDVKMWRQIVIDGLLKDRGMASFRNYLTPTQAESIRAYVNARAKADGT